MNGLDSETGDDDTAPDAAPLNPAVTRELFLEWRSPRFGISNPERMNNPVWEWLVESGIDAYHANERLNGPSATDAGPCWCFDRLGQSSTFLPDGRLVLVAGEHEDSYDPDFHIYNDVVVRHPDGRNDILGYPREVFPPTDFHTATLVNNRIVLIGNLGYPDQRRHGQTQVILLDLGTLAISQVQTSGSQPGWIHSHKATLSNDSRSILVQQGKLHRGGEDRSLVENIDDWRLHLGEWRWERLTERNWPRWEVRRADGEGFHLFAYEQAVSAESSPALRNLYDEDGEIAKVMKELDIPTLTEALGKEPDLDLFKRRYRPPVEHAGLPVSDDEFSVHRIKIKGVIVRYVEDFDSVQMTVEGALPQETLSILSRDLLDKLSALENSPCELVRL